MEVLDPVFEFSEERGPCLVDGERLGLVRRLSLPCVYGPYARDYVTARREPLFDYGLSDTRRLLFIRSGREDDNELIHKRPPLFFRARLTSLVEISKGKGD